MGIVQIQIKIMPASPETDLEELKEQIKKVIQKAEGKNCRFREEPVAFGLRAVILGFDIPEEQELEPIENKLSKIENVNSVQVIDMRRAVG